MNFETMSKQRKMILIAAAVGVISIFLPWTSFAGFTANGMRGGGIICFICFLAAGFFAYTGDQATNLNKMNWMLTLIVGGIAFLIGIINFFDAPKAVIGFGLYVSIVASIGILVGAYMHRSAGDSLQSGFDSLKSGFNQQTQGTPNSPNDPTRPTP